MHDVLIVVRIAVIKLWKKLPTWRLATITKSFKEALSQKLLMNIAM